MPRATGAAFTARCTGAVHAFQCIGALTRELPVRLGDSPDSPSTVTAITFAACRSRPTPSVNLGLVGSSYAVVGAARVPPAWQNTPTSRVAADRPCLPPTPDNNLHLVYCRIVGDVVVAA